MEKKISAVCFVTCFVVPASLLQAATNPAAPSAGAQRTAQAGTSKPEKPASNKRGKKAKGKKSNEAKHKHPTQQEEFDQTLMGIYG